MINRTYADTNILTRFLGNSQYGLSLATTDNETILCWTDFGATKLHIPNKGVPYATYPTPKPEEESVWVVPIGDDVHKLAEKRMEEYPVLKKLYETLKRNEERFKREDAYNVGLERNLCDNRMHAVVQKQD